MLLEGKLSKVEVVEGTSGYLAILVSPKDVQEVLPRDTSHLPLCKKDAAKLMGVSLTALDNLLGLKGHTPVLGWVEDKLPGPIRVRVELSEVECFLRKYVTLGELQRRTGLHQQTMRRFMQKADVQTAHDPKETKVYLYNRNEAISAIS